MGNNRKGQGLVEYALILALVSIIAIPALSQLGNNLNKTFNTINNAMANPTSNNAGSNINNCAPHPTDSIVGI